MKKRLFVSAIAVALVIACVCAFAACTPSVDSLKKTYDGEGYICADIDVEKVADYFKDAAKEAGVELEGESSIKYAFTATKVIDTVVVVAFTDSSVAKDMYEALGGKDSKFAKKKGNAVAFAISAGESEGLNLF